jgi:hypothetical protein
MQPPKFVLKNQLYIVFTAYTTGSQRHFLAKYTTYLQKQYW